MKEAAGDVSHVAPARALEPAAGPQLRVLFVDWLRCFAAFQMLQGHTIAAVLAPRYRTGSVYALWSFARGLTSVAFLFTAGMAFYFACARELARPRGQRRVFGRRARRALMLIALGYVLHLPVGALFTADPRAHEQLLRAFVGIDILQCIGVSLAVLELLLWLLPGARSFIWVCTGASIVLLALTPWTSGVSVAPPLSALVAYVSTAVGSSFPLLPWATHLFFGVACGAWLLVPGWPRAELRLLLAAGVLLAVCVTLQAVWGPSIVSDHLQRLGSVLLVSALLAWLAARVRRTHGLISLLARDTLLLYVSHVLLIYGQGLGLADWVGRRLAPASAIALAALVVVGSGALVVGYRRLRGGRLAAAVRTG